MTSTFPKGNSCSHQGKEAQPFLVALVRFQHLLSKLPNGLYSRCPSMLDLSAQLKFNPQALIISRPIAVITVYEVNTSIAVVLWRRDVIALSQEFVLDLAFPIYR